MTDRDNWNQKIIDEFRATGGEVGGQFAGAPLLLLTTTGAKTGRKHTTPMMYLADGDRLAVFVSKAGASTNPDWCRNLLADPRATVDVGSETFEVDAEPAARRGAGSSLRHPVRALPGLRGVSGEDDPGDPRGPLETRRIVSASPDPTRVLVVTAHPDDVDFGAAGSIATWTDQGIPVSYCIVTDGAAGSAVPGIEAAALRQIRQDEQRKAAAEVGVTDVHFLGYPDGSLVVSLKLRRDIARMIRIVRPDRVVCQSPERNWERIRASHPDHLAAGEATLQAVYPDARNPYAYPELLEAGLEPHVVEEVWLMASPRSTRGVDITATIERKLGALRSHQSQLAETANLEEMIRSWAANNAVALGMPEGRLAEAFQVVDTR